MTGSKRRLARALIAFVVFLALVAAACGGDDGESGTGGPATEPGTGGGEESEDPAEAADRDGELKVALSFSFNNLDPHRSVSAGDQIWMRPTYDRLLTVANGEDGVELAPQLATSWEYAADGLSLEFELRDDVTFQDGTKFDANAVKANMDRAMGPDSTVKSNLASVSAVEVVDPTHVVYRLSRPDPALTWSLATTAAAMIVSPTAMANPDLATKPVGSGPWRLVSAQKDGDAVWERWDDHWDPDAALAKTLIVSTIVDQNVRYNGTRTGEYDAAYLGAPLDAQSKSLESEGYHWVTAFAPIATGALLHTAKPPFDDVRVRQAVNMAINRQEVSEELYVVSPPAFQPFLEGYLGYDPDLDDDPYDPEAARDLVREAGAEGASFRVIQNSTPPTSQLGEIVQQALSDIGLQPELVPFAPTALLSEWQKGEYEMMVGSMLAYAEPSLTLQSTYLGAQNVGGQKDPQLVQMADEGVRLPVGSAEREEHYQDIGAFLVDNPVHVPLIQFTTTFLARPEVVGSENLAIEVLGRLDFRGVGVTSS